MAKTPEVDLNDVVKWGTEYTYQCPEDDCPARWSAGAKSVVLGLARQHIAMVHTE